MRRGFFCAHLVVFAIFGGRVDGFALGKFLDDSWEDSEETPWIAHDAEQRENKPSSWNNVGAQQRRRHSENEADYAGNIFEKLLSGKVIDEALDALADCIDDSGIFDFLDPSEEEIDSNASGTEGNKPEVPEISTDVVDATTISSNVTVTPTTAAPSVADEDVDSVESRRNVTIG